MTHRIKRLIGPVLTGSFLASYGLAALAQPAGSASAASQPPSNPLTYPVDPTWLVITLIVGLIIGYLIGVKRAAGKANASHA
jgi:hypothetical protein